MNKFHLILIVLCVFNCAYCDPIHFSDCGSLYDLKSVDISGCKQLPCPLLMGTSINVTVKMIADFQAKRAFQEIYFTTKSIHTASKSTPETCTTERPCPISLGDASFSTKLWVPDIAPFPSRLTWKITDDHSRNLMCFYTDVYLCYENDSDPNCY